MARYESYSADAAEAPAFRRWLFAALLLSLLIHGGLLLFFYSHRLEGFSLPEERLAPPRVFSMKRVSIPMEPAPAEQKMKMQEKASAPAKIEIPLDKPVVTEVHLAPQVVDLAKPILTEKPKVEMSGLETLMKRDAAGKSDMDKELNAIAQNLIKEGPKSPRQPILAAGRGPTAGGGEGDANVNIPGMASIDEMISRTGPLKAGERAGMPGGALFEYDSFELRADAVEQLRKVGALIQKNPGSTFSIEGHTDSFGSPEYNQRLSEMRAEEVKHWLVETLGIPAERIQTRGFGNAKPLVPADKSREEQAPNRRVELVVKTKAR